MSSAESKETKNELEFKFKNNLKSLELKDAIIDSYRKHRKCSTLPDLVENIKKDLDSQFTKGWVVFGGKHMVGACSYIEDTLLDFEVDGNSYVIFQTFVPDE